MLLKEKIVRRIDVTWRRGRRRKQLMNDLKEKRGFFKFKEEAIDRTLWRTWFGSGNGPVLRQTTKWILVRGVGLDRNGTDLEKIRRFGRGGGGVYWLHLLQHRGPNDMLLKHDTNLRVTQQAVHNLTSWTTASFRGTLQGKTAGRIIRKFWPLTSDICDWATAQ